MAKEKNSSIHCKQLRIFGFNVIKQWAGFAYDAFSIKLELIKEHLIK